MRALPFRRSGFWHATASLEGALALAFMLSLLGCEAQPKTRTVRVSTHTLPACSLDPRHVESAELRLFPLGDFAMAEEPLEPLLLSERTDLALPPGLRALGARVETSEQRFLAYSERTETNELRLLLWPSDRGCRLDSKAFTYPRSGDGQAIGFSPETRSLLLAGGSAPFDPAASVAALTFDAGDGTATLLEAGSASGASLASPRAFASITPFGSQLLVAGGEDPLVAPDGLLPAPRQTAEVFDPKVGGFMGELIELSVPRSRHTAVRLASGDTLLVGGLGPRGHALNVLETISSTDGKSSIAGLRALKYPRLFPAVFSLDDGRLFVGAGTAADGTPVAAFEWFSNDARTYLDNAIPTELPPRHDRAVAALPGGGVLLVGGCQPNSDLACAGPCRSGCPPVGSSPDGSPTYDAWWLAPDKTLTALELDIEAPRPVLVGGAEGMPVLSGGGPGSPGLHRFNPWTERFEPMPQQVSAAPRAGLPWTLLDAGAIAWLSEGDSSLELYGLRVGTRDRFASDIALVSGTLAEELRPPFPLVPDRPTRGKVRFDAGSALLVFESDSTARIFVAGTDYAGFSLDLWVEGDAPRVVLGTTEFGGPECPWPEGAKTRFRLERHGENVELSSGSLVGAPCRGPSGRARLGIYRGTGAMVLRHASIVRNP